jgi:acyl-CoA thioesterase-1
MADRLYTRIRPARSGAGNLIQMQGAPGSSGGQPNAGDRRRRAWVYAAICALAVFGAALTACSEKPAEETAAAPPATAQGTIVAVGDSLTAGLGVPEDQAYPAQLARRLAADGHDFMVVNAGVSGETSSGALSRIDWVISSLAPDIVILVTGANDGLRGLDPGLLESNLEALVARLKAEGIQVILGGMLMLPNLGPAYTQAFAEIYPRVADRHDLLFIPFFLDGVAGKAALNQPDRLHPTAAGYTRIVETVYPVVLEAIERHRKEQSASVGAYRG